jgi:hypothetical protein
VTSIAFDSTALIHFARAGRLTELQNASADNEPVLLAEVARELEKGAPQHPSLDDAAKAWLKPVELTEIAELAAFAMYKTCRSSGPPQAPARHPARERSEAHARSGPHIAHHP